jgi:hypothetical protein
MRAPRAPTPTATCSSTIKVEPADEVGLDLLTQLRRRAARPRWDPTETPCRPTRAADGRSSLCDTSNCVRVVDCRRRFETSTSQEWTPAKSTPRRCVLAAARIRRPRAAIASRSTDSWPSPTRPMMHLPVAGRGKWDRTLARGPRAPCDRASGAPHVTDIRRVLGAFTLL